MLTIETTKEQLEKLTKNAFVLFVPNKLSCGEIIINPGLHPKLYSFLEEYFYGYYKGVQQFKPYAWADCLLDEIEEETFDETSLATTDDMLPYNTIQEWLTTVVENFGDNTIIICSHYQ